MKAERVCDVCKKNAGFIEYEHQGVTTEKSVCLSCNWFHIVVDGEEEFRGVPGATEEADETDATVTLEMVALMFEAMSTKIDGLSAKVDKLVELLQNE